MSVSVNFILWAGLCSFVSKLSLTHRKSNTYVNNLEQIAVVVVPKTDEHARRTTARAKELGKEVPIEAVNDMKGISYDPTCQS